MKKYKIEKRVNEAIKSLKLDKLRGLNRITKALWKETGDEDYRKMNREVRMALLARLQ